MRGITFTDPVSNISFHSGDDCDLVMSEKIIGSPSVKLKTIALPDRDGDLDYTEALRGVPSYGTRPLRFTFEYLNDPDDWTALFTGIRNFLHGRRMKIVEPDDPLYYYMGRCEVGEPEGTVVKKFVVEVTADTWKYKYGGETVVSKTASSGQTISISNDFRPVVPTIQTNKAVSFTFGGKTYSLSGSGTFKLPQIILKYGTNLFQLTSGTSVTMKFTYQEGAI